MKHNGKKIRTIAYIVLFALSACAFVAGIIMHAMRVYAEAKSIILYVAYTLFFAGAVVALIDMWLNADMKFEEQSPVTKQLFKAFGCGISSIFLMVILLIVFFIALVLIVFVAYGSQISS